MPKTKHIATAPNGQTFKRTSESRVYSHMVAVRRSRGAAHANAISDGHTKQDGLNWDYFNDKVTGRVAWYDFESEESRQRDRDRVAEGRQAYIDRLRAERVKAVQDTNFDKWFDAGWASRLDLAEKNAATMRAKSWYAEVKILEAKIV